jgi:formylglycine-generating enzyme required for sulfatase activity
MRFRSAVLPLSVLGCLAASSALADEAPPWMANYEASKDQPIGMDDAAIKTYLEKQWKSDWPKEKNPPFDETWKKVFLLMTPAWKADVPAFRLAKFEVSNAQWERFLEDRIDTYETVGDETLEQMAEGVWQLPSAEHITRGWRVLIARNAAALMPVLNPKNDPKWDAMVAQAASQKLPKGLKLSYPRYLPDATWVEGTGAERVWGKLPEALRKKPVSFLSWEQAADFCSWAGFHLPTELEWERAARGPQGRAFPWGDAWDPTMACWKGYNAAAMKANRQKKAEPPVPDLPVIMAPGTSGEPESTTPCAADVDSFPQGATPEGVLNLAGNVSEFTAWRAWKYPGTKTTFSGFDGSVCVARGGNFIDRAEVFLAADRSAEGPGGLLLPANAVEGYGFRIASYPVPGADLTLPLALRYNDDRGGDTPFFWMPIPAGCPDKKAGRDFYGFDPQLTAGILERQTAATSPDFVFVTGGATGIAFLPVKGVAQEHVKSASDLQRHATNPDRPVVLGILTGTEHSAFRVVVATTNENAEPVLNPTTISFSDPRLQYTDKHRPDRLLSREFIGAVLVLEGEKVAVYAPNATLAGPAKYRSGLLGHLEQPPTINGVKKGEEGPTGSLAGDVALLETTLPFLDRKGQPVASGSTPGIRVQIGVPFVRKFEAPAK